MRTTKGFTLVEILIVVVILGILAAIVIPQFTDASTEAKTASVKSDLQTVRSQIQLYKIQHNDALPGAGTAGFEACMTGTTDIDGSASGSDFGPYLQQIPTNGFDLSNETTNDDSVGWYYDLANNGAFHVDDGDANHEAW